MRVLGILVFLYYAYGLNRLSKKEKEIFKLKSEIDGIESDSVSKRTLHSGYVNQAQFEKITQKRREPMERQLETLKLERQYILEKIPLLGLFKK